MAQSPAQPKAAVPTPKRVADGGLLCTPTVGRTIPDAPILHYHPGPSGMPAPTFQQNCTPAAGASPRPTGWNQSVFRRSFVGRTIPDAPILHYQPGPSGMPAPTFQQNCTPAAGASPRPTGWNQSVFCLPFVGRTIPDAPVRTPSNGPAPYQTRARCTWQRARVVLFSYFLYWVTPLASIQAFLDAMSRSRLSLRLPLVSVKYACIS